ncbi:MAG: hypothetical protein ACI97A_003626 [Planctomycetota bacterium]
MNDPRIIYNVAALDAAHLDQLMAKIPHHRRLSDVLAWAAHLTPSRKPILSLAQDEYAHDVVIDYDTETFLVYDVT